MVEGLPLKCCRLGELLRTWRSREPGDILQTYEGPWSTSVPSTLVLALERAQGVLWAGLKLEQYLKDFALRGDALAGRMFSGRGRS